MCSLFPSDKKRKKHRIWFLWKNWNAIWFPDFSTDGKWCYLLFWVVERGRKATRWSLLKKRLIAACPPASSPLGIDSYYFNRRQETATEQNPQVFLLMFSCYDRMGLLHGNITRLCSSVVAYHASICMESGFSLNLGILDLIFLWNLQVASITCTYASCVERFIYILVLLDLIRFQSIPLFRDNTVLVSLFSLSFVCADSLSLHLFSCTVWSLSVDVWVYWVCTL